MPDLGGLFGLLGGITSGVGALQSGNAKQAAAQYNAQIAGMNAQEAELAAPVKIAQQQRKAGQVIGEAIARYGASGVDSGSGTPMEVIQQGATQSALDSLLIQHSADQKAYGYAATANLDLYEGSQSQTASKFTAASDLLGGLSSFFGGSGGGGGGGSGDAAPEVVPI